MAAPSLQKWWRKAKSVLFYKNISKRNWSISLNFKYRIMPAIILTKLAFLILRICFSFLKRLICYGWHFCLFVLPCFLHFSLDVCYAFITFVLFRGYRQVVIIQHAWRHRHNWVGAKFGGILACVSSHVTINHVPATRSILTKGVRTLVWLFSCMGPLVGW